jgi:hypothetical protein
VWRFLEAERDGNAIHLLFRHPDCAYFTAADETEPVYA